MSLLKTTTLSAMASSLLVLGLGASPASHAIIFTNLSPSGACMASSGPGADNFYFSPIQAQNTAAVSHYIVCNLTMPRRVSTDSPTNVNLHFINPHASTRTVNCVLYTTHSGVGGTDSYSFSHVAAANSAHSSLDTLAAVTISDGFSHLALSCLVPAGVGLGGITVVTPGSIPA